MYRFFSIFLILSVFTLASCKSAPVITGAESDAEVVYKEGIYYLSKAKYDVAEKKFMKVIADFSYSKYEPYATVALGDTYFYKEDYPSAVEVYSRFVKMRPKHEKTPWAQLQIANSYFAQKPSDFFLFPNPAEKDIDIVDRSVAQYRFYLKNYPEDGNKDKGIAKLEKAELVLIERDLRVAEFYSHKKKCGGVRARLKSISDNFTITTEKNRKRIAKLLAKCPEQPVEKTPVEKTDAK